MSRAALGLWLAATALLTLTPQEQPLPGESIPFLCLMCGERGLADGILNIVLFLPFGLLVRSLGPGILTVAVAGSSLSVGIEMIQQFLPGRYATAADVVWNGAGASLGAVLWVYRRRLLDPEAHIGRRLGWLSVAAVGATVTFTGLMLTPQGTEARYWGQWTPDLGFMDHYDGELLDAELNGVPIPSGRYPDHLDPAGALRSDWTLRTVVVKGSPPVRVAPIVSVFDERRREVFVLGAQGEDLLWRERMRGVELNLDHPDLRVPGALSGHARGDTIEVSARRVGTLRCLEVAGDARCQLGFTPGRAWGLLAYPSSLSTLAKRGLDFLWVLMLFVPVGYYSRRRNQLLAGTLSAVVLLYLSASVTPLVWSPWTELAGAMAGAVAGFWARLPTLFLLGRDGSG